MRSRGLKVAKIPLSYLILMACFLNSPYNLFAQTQSNRSFQVVSRSTYNQVLDILFPRDDFQDNDLIYVFILRFEPSSHSESQLVIKRRPEAIEVIKYRSLDGNIYVKLNQMLAETKNEDAKMMAKKIRTEKKLLNIPVAQVKQWHSDLLDGISILTKQLKEQNDIYDKEGTVEITLDGTFYELWYVQGLHGMSCNVYDSEIGERPTGKFRLTQWMNGVRLTIENASK